MEKGIKQKYIDSAVFMLASTVIVKVIGAVYKIPLTAYIGATGRGYFSIAYNLCLPVHALTMGAFPVALTKLVSSYNAKGNKTRIVQLRKASKKLFFIVGFVGVAIMFLIAKPYADFISSSPKSIYTILALAPSLFFSCLCACNRAFSEGFLDMKATAISQLLEATFKMIFGLLFAKLSMSKLYELYLLNGTVLGVVADNEQQALSMIYPITSACAMLATTLGSLVAYAFAKTYTSICYSDYTLKKINCKEAYNELLKFSAPLVGATVVQSIANFADTSSIQYCLSLCDKSVLASVYNVDQTDVCTYVYGIFATALDFKNLVPAIVMALGVTAVPAISTAYESSATQFNHLINSIIKYTVVLCVFCGLALSLFSTELLSVFYAKSNSDIVLNAREILFYSGVTILPCAMAVTTVYCTQALGYANKTILPYVVGGIVRLVINFILIPNSKVNILGALVSNFIGFFVIVISNLIIIHKKTNTKFQLFNILFKPVFVGFITYFLMIFVKNKFFENSVNISCLVILTIILISFYAILLLTFGIVSANDLKRLK